MTKGQSRRKSLSRRPTARSVAVSVVHQVRFGQDAVQAALDRAYGRLHLPEQERPLCTELVYGTLRNFDRLEFFLRRFLERFDSLPREMTIALCVGVYELFYTRVPTYATVDTFVALIRRQFGPVLGKVANGVLRNVDRSRKDFYDEQWYLRHLGTPLAAQACWYSVPEWLVEVWHKAYGGEAARLYLEASFKAAPNSLRFNRQAVHAPDFLKTDVSRASTDAGKSSASEHFLYSGKNVANVVSGGASHRNSSRNVARSGRVAEASHVVATDAGPSFTHGGHATDHSQACREAFLSLFPFSREARCGGAEHVQASVGSVHQGNEGAMDEPFLARAEVLWRSSSASPVLSFDGPLPRQAYGYMEEGLVSQQSGAVLEILSKLNPQEWPGPVWDCCCGRGGKTLALLEQGVQVALASDISSPRLRGLGEELDRLGLRGACHVERFSATEDITASKFYTATGVKAFGTILVDAPCSGFGTLARHPEIRFRRTLEDVTKLAALQRAMLENAFRWLEEGGNVIYITCTLMPEENEEQIARFLKAHASMKLVNTFLTPPHSPHGEFFYGARLVKG